jgi:cytosine/adenosine deaminase-related metal-dependent hydrolase
MTTAGASDVVSEGAMQRARCDLLVTNAFVISMDADRTLFPDGAIAIADGRIVDVGPAARIASVFRPDQTIDARGAPVHPGFVECHVHLLHTARGAFPDSLDYAVALNLYARWWDALSEEDDYRGSLLAIVEMVRHGVTCFAEAGTLLNPAAAAAAVEAVGIRASLCDGFVWDQGHVLPLERAPASLERSLGVLGSQLWRNRDPDALVRGHVGAYGMDTCSMVLVAAAKACADEAGVIFCQHQSFEEEDVSAQRRELGTAPVLYMAEHGILDANTTFAHMNVLDPDEQKAVAESGMSIVWNVSSSMVWGVGGTRHGRHSQFHREGVTVGLGADACNSSCRFDPGLQALLAVLTAREKELDRKALGAEDALEMLTIKGAQAIGMADQIGSLEPGKRADLVIRSMDGPEMMPGLDPLQSVVFSGASKAVGTVIVNGSVVVDNGHAARVDEAQVFAQACETSRDIMRRIGMIEVPQIWPQVR